MAGVHGDVAFAAHQSVSAARWTSTSPDGPQWTPTTPTTTTTTTPIRPPIWPTEIGPKLLAQFRLCRGLFFPLGRTKQSQGKETLVFVVLLTSGALVTLFSFSQQGQQQKSTLDIEWGPTLECHLLPCRWLLLLLHQICCV